MNTSAIRDLVVADFYDHGLSYGALAEKYGRDPSTIRKIVTHYRHNYRAANNGNDRPRKIVPSSRKKLEDAKPISVGHAAIGMRISRYMQRHNRSATAFGLQLTPMQSPMVINQACIGAHDWTLGEVQSLATFFKVTVPQLLTLEPELAHA